MSATARISPWLRANAVHLLVLGLVVAAWIYWWWRHSHLDPNELGDAFGVLNALFTGLAFLGLLHQINLQRRDLSLQTNELELQREAMQELAKQARKDAEASHASLALAAWRRLLAAARDVSIATRDYASYKNSQLLDDGIGELSSEKRAHQKVIRAATVGLGRAIDEVVVMDRQARNMVEAGNWEVAAMSGDDNGIDAMLDKLEWQTRSAVARLHRYIPDLPDPE